MRKSISVTFFSMVATLLVLGTAVLGCSEWLLFSRYFAQERYDTLDSVADVTQRAADYIVQQAALPKGAELDALNTKLEIIGESAEAYLFFTDEEGRVLIASNPEMVGTDVVGPELMEKVAGDQPYHTLSTLDGVLTEKSYVSVRHMQDAQGNNSGYLFLCSSGARLTDFKEEFWSNFFFSACIMLLCASVLTSVLMRRLTDPLQKITEAAQRFGSQCVVVAIDARRRPDGSGWDVYKTGGRQNTGLDALEWAARVEALGAGEILLTSMDADGTKAGYDLELTRTIAENVSIPVIASGGCGSLEHFSEVFEKTGCDAALAASLFHYRELTVGEVKEHLKEKGIPVRK